MSDSSYSNAMLLCGYIFHCIHKLEEDIRRKAVVTHPMPILVAAFFAPLSLTALHPDADITEDFYDCVAARLGAYHSSAMMDLFFSSTTDFIKCYTRSLPFEKCLDYTLYLAFDAVYDIPSDEWIDKYRSTALDLAHSVLNLADDLVVQDAPPSSPEAPTEVPPEAPPEPKAGTRSSRIAYLVAVVAVIIAIIAVIIAVSTSHSSSVPISHVSSTSAVSEPVVSPVPSSPEPNPEPQPESLPLPRNGCHYPIYDFSGATMSSICVHAPSTSNCFVIIKRSSTGAVLDRFFVRSGSTVDTYCPIGTLDIYFAFGDDWYGTELLFGDDTRCQVDREVEFTDTAYYEYTLYPVTDGNLHMPEVSVEEAISG